MKKFFTKPTRWLILLFLLVTYVILMINLGRDALFDWDEGIYGELGRQVVVTKNIFTTYWNGAPWLEKPPGIAWISGLGIALAGESSYGARLLMPLFAIYVLYIVYKIGSRLGDYRHGLLAAGVLAGLNLFLGRTRAVNTDMPLLAAITTTILFLVENRPAWWVALAIFGGVWFKGIAGLLSVIIALPLFLTKSRKFIVQTISAVLALTLPWHLYMYFKYGYTFINPYFFEQVVRRATAQIEFHFESRWYYVIYLYENLGLGVLLVAALGALSALQRIFVGSKQRVFYLTLIWWALIPLIIFTLAKTRLFWYILPLYPALALLISEIIGRFTASKLQKNVVLILAIGVLTKAIFTTAASVEINKTNVDYPDRLQVVQMLSHQGQRNLAVLVPPSERLSEALLPEVARLSSSFRYGGMPAVAFYYHGPITFYYDVDKFRDYWIEATDPLALIATEDKELIPTPFQEVVTTKTYLGIQKGTYALR